MAKPPAHQQLFWTALRRPIAVAAGECNIVDIAAETVPIVFVPGIMGTRLSNAAGQAVWDPDHTLHMLLDHVRHAHHAARRRDVLSLSAWGAPGPLHPRGTAAPAADGTQQLVQGTYRKAVTGLRQALAQRRPSSRLCFATPLWAVGYDWVGSPQAAAHRLAQQVRAIIAHEAQSHVCRRAILVTHSYGGLVARAACRLFGLEDALLGLVHVGQPALGAPAAYVHFLAGAPRLPQETGLAAQLTQLCLGPDGPSAAGLLAYMPGALCLLPWQSAANAPWLQLRGRHARDDLPRAEPSPFEAIYRRYDTAIGLLDERAPDFAEDCAALEHNLTLAQAFHRDVGTWAHPRSVHIVGTAQPSYTQVTLLLGAGAPADLKSLTDARLARAPRRTVGAKGSYVLSLSRDPRALCALQPPDGDGDGTVPVASAAALGRIHRQPVIEVPHAAHATMMQHPAVLGACVRAIDELLGHWFGAQLQHV